MLTDHPDAPCICFTVRPEVIPLFSPLLQTGVFIKGRVGYSIRSFLHLQLHFSSEYIDQRIQTFFLNGKAVDDIDAALIHDCSTLALSAAMPGLVGATLRKGSYYASMRSSISYTEETKSMTPREGTVRLKLFNLLTTEMGPALLRQGVWIERKELLEFFEKQSARFWSGCVEIRVNGKRMEPSELPGMGWQEKVFMKLQEI